MALDPALKAYLDAMQETLTQQMTRLNDSTNERLDSTNERLDSTNERLDSTNQRIETVNAAIRRELGTLIEEVHGDVKLLAEAVAINNDRIAGLLTDHEQRLTRLEARRG